MIEVIEGIFSLLSQFINWFFTLEIDLANNVTISIGELAVIFVFVIVALFIILRAIGVIRNLNGGGSGDSNS